MDALSIQLHWQRTEPELRPGSYSNAHIVQFNGDHDLQVDAAPDWGGDPANTNPEQALASAMSSCSDERRAAATDRSKSHARRRFGTSGRSSPSAALSRRSTV